MDYKSREENVERVCYALQAFSTPVILPQKR
jgi:hypothetical protein